MPNYLSRQTSNHSNIAYRAATVGGGLEFLVRTGTGINDVAWQALSYWNTKKLLAKTGSGIADVAWQNVTINNPDPTAGSVNLTDSVVQKIEIIITRTSDGATGHHWNLRYDGTYWGGKGDYYSGTSYMKWDANLRAIDCNCYRNLGGDRDTTDYACIQSNANQAKSPVFTSSDMAIVRTIRRMRIFTSADKTSPISSSNYKKLYECKYTSTTDLSRNFDGETRIYGVKFNGYSYVYVPTSVPNDDTEDYPFLRFAFFTS